MSKRSCGISSSSLQKGKVFIAAFLPAAAFGFGLVRWAGLHQMVRQQVSPRGGNKLAFVLLKGTLNLIFALLGPLEIQGAEHVPLEGGVIIAPNHISDSDVPAVGVALPRWAWFLAKEELFSIPVWGKVFTFTHAFPIRRAGPADRAAMKHILEPLAEGEAVVIFPEGRVSEDGTFQEFQSGPAMLALRAGVPIIPMALSGTQKVIPYGEVIPRPSFSRVHIRFGPPIDFTNLPEERHARLAEATARLHKGVEDLLREIAPEFIRR